MKDGFERYLIKVGKGEKTVQNYLGAFTFINRIAKENGIPKIENWNISNSELYINQIKEDQTFIEQNTKGNNMYSASLNNYLKYMKEHIETPELPFETFGWRWATTGIASHLNQPTSLKVVLDAILINGNGEDNYTQEFKNLIHKLCINKYKISEEESDKLTKISNLKIEKNIIENSANYWYHLGLLETTGKYARVSELGEKFLNGLISNDEFILNRINNYFLPNEAYKNEEIKEWTDLNIKIYPLKLIQDIFIQLQLFHEENQQYLREDDLTNIIIPCSYDLEKFPVDYITNRILEFRKNPNDFLSWPNPQQRYTDDKGMRMANEFLYFLEVFGFLSTNQEGKVRSSDKKYFSTQKFVSIEIDKNGMKTVSRPIVPIDFNIKNFQNDCKSVGLVYSNKLITRFVSSLLTKPFVILTGLSGSGKTKLAQAFVQWICQEKNQYRIIPVGADWTNREPLLGYPNALKPEEYVKPDSGVIDLIIQANSNPELPHFLILDEMNLSHVERYFADFLSVMESKEEIPLYAEGTVENGVPAKLKVPSNLFIIGTVNIDETTNMFSPKVLDRANTIEFRVTQNEMKNFLSNIKDINMDALTGKGTGMAGSFLEMAASKEFATTDIAEINAALIQFFGELKKTGAEFGYRSATEILRLIHQLTALDNTLTTNQKIDIAIIQKLLPKLHGSRRKLCPVLETLGSFCIRGNVSIIKDVFDKTDFDYNGAFVLYPLSLEKIARMYRGAIDNGFASFAEA